MGACEKCSLAVECTLGLWREIAGLCRGYVFERGSSFSTSGIGCRSLRELLTEALHARSSDQALALLAEEPRLATTKDAQGDFPIHQAAAQVRLLWHWPAAAVADALLHLACAAHSRSSEAFDSRLGPAGA